MKFQTGSYGVRIYNDGKRVVIGDTRAEIEINPGRTAFSVPCGTPDFYIRKNRGDLVVNPYYTTSSEESFPSASVLHQSICIKPQSGKNFHDVWSAWYPPTSVWRAMGIKPSGSSPIPDPSFSKEALITKARAMANEGVWDASTSLAELGETAAMIALLLKGVRRPLQTLIEISQKAWRSNKRRGSTDMGSLNVKGVLDLTSSGWLLWRYGIRPTIGDIESAINAYNAKAKLKFRHSVRPSGNDTSVGQDQLIIMAQVRPNVRVAIPCGTIEYGFENKGRCVITTDYEYESATAYWREQLGFTGRAIPKVAWELVPFSFVVDWFLNVGQWIDTLQPPNGCTQRVCSYGARSSLYEKKTLVRCKWTEETSYGEVWELSLSPTTYSRKSETFERTVESPGAIQTPNTGTGFNTLRSLDLASIFYQLKHLLRKH